MLFENLYCKKTKIGYNVNDFLNQKEMDFQIQLYFQKITGIDQVNLFF